MALSSTLHHLDLRFSQADVGVDGDVSVKVARHPSETMERLWLRILAFAWKWREGLAFGPGLCEPDAPDLSAVLPDGRAAVIIRVGKPEPQRIERDVNRNAGADVAVLFESPRRLEAFLAEAREQRFSRAAAADLAAADPGLLAELGAREERRIKASITIVADHLYVEVGGRTLDAPLHRAGA
ncbi:MAG TPA: YaeQ family protein [Anaeromyxobacter sp.]